MPKLNSAVLATAVVVFVAIGAAAFRVSTAPDRIRDRRNEARATCESTGGAWVLVDGREACRKNGDWIP